MLTDKEKIQTEHREAACRNYCVGKWQPCKCVSSSIRQPLMCETKGSWTLCFMLMMGVAQGCMYHFFRPILLSAVAPLEGVAQTEPMSFRLLQG